jgi:hypothetical protein
MSEDEYALPGYFELAVEGDLVVLRCRWPFDRDADEWINIKNFYYASDYSKAISDAAARRQGTGKAQGVDGGFLEVAEIDSGFIIEFSRPQGGWCANSLRLRIGRPIGELSLQALPFKAVHGGLYARH